MKCVLTIAGSDSSGGAGIQADLKTFEAFGVFGSSAITVLTAQNTAGVHSIHPLPTDFIIEQIDAVLADFSIDAIKIGMLYDTPVIEAVKNRLKGLNIPIVLDPVSVSKAGSPLLKAEAVHALREFSTSVAVSTPNLYEANLLYGYQVNNNDIFSGELCHPTPVLVKNHTLQSPEPQSIDILYSGDKKEIFPSVKIETSNLHGTGCSYSSAIAANLALGHSLDQSIIIAKSFITEALRHAPSIGHGPGPINHKQGGLHVS